MFNLCLSYNLCVPSPMWSQIAYADDTQVSTSTECYLLKTLLFGSKVSVHPLPELLNGPQPCSVRRK